jgi:hypothetical protein
MLSIQERRTSNRRAALSVVASPAHHCEACSGLMRMDMAWPPSPSLRRSGECFYLCEYVCDECGNREMFEEVP